MQGAVTILLSACNIMIRFALRPPNAIEFIKLRAETDWGTPSPIKVERALSHSPWGIVAFDQDQLIGMARCVGDGVLILYLQDVIIAGTHRGRGIGRQLISTLIRHLEDHCDPDCMIGLFAAKGQSGFYKSLGFGKRDNPYYGPGMYGNFSELLTHSLAISATTT